MWMELQRLLRCLYERRHHHLCFERLIELSQRMLRGRLDEHLAGRNCECRVSISGVSDSVEVLENRRRIRKGLEREFGGGGDSARSDAAAVVDPVAVPLEMTAEALPAFVPHSSSPLHVQISSKAFRTARTAIGSLQSTACV